jgi:hypothetical protein
LSTQYLHCFLDSPYITNELLIQSIEPKQLSRQLLPYLVQGLYIKVLPLLLHHHQRRILRSVESYGRMEGKETTQVRTNASYIQCMLVCHFTSIIVVHSLNNFTFSSESIRCRYHSCCRFERSVVALLRQLLFIRSGDIPCLQSIL